MNNPFTNTKHYMIVRQYKRLTTKKRSFSNSSQQSISQKKTNKYEDYGYYCKNLLVKSKVDNQYMFTTATMPVHLIQRKRAEVFGIEELRYKPTYFDSLDKYQQKQYEKSTKNIPERTKSIKSVKSQKQINRIRFQSPPPSVQSSQKQVQQQNNIQISQYQLQKKSQLKRRDSILQQMIEIGGKNSNRFNQLYASHMNLKSKSDIFMSSMHVPMRRRSNTKVSLFYDEHQNQVGLSNQKKKYFQQQQIQNKQQQSLNQSKITQQYLQQQISQNQKTQSDKYLKYSNKTIDKSKKYSQKSIQKSKSKSRSKFDIEKQIPYVLKIRDKVYYRYVKNNRRY